MDAAENPTNPFQFPDRNALILSSVDHKSTPSEYGQQYKLIRIGLYSAKIEQTHVQFKLRTTLNHFIYSLNYCFHNQTHTIMHKIKRKQVKLKHNSTKKRRKKHHSTAKVQTLFNPNSINPLCRVTIPLKLTEDNSPDLIQGPTSNTWGRGTLHFRQIKTGKFEKQR